MSKSTHFSGQPIYGQLINLLDKQKNLEFCETVGKERYIKHFDGWQHLLLYEQSHYPSWSNSLLLLQVTCVE